VAEANLRVASVAFDQTLIRAPFTGIVLTKSANVGDIVTPFSAAAGTTGAVVTMADMETLRGRCRCLGVVDRQDRGRAAGRNPAGCLSGFAAGR
jgi:multidrug efflux pump subunit AcrA (membrane-fusion protein)